MNHMETNSFLWKKSIKIGYKFASSTGQLSSLYKLARAATNDYFDNWLVGRLFFRLIGLNTILFYWQKTSGGPLSALTCCVNVRLLSAIKKIIAINLFSKLGWELGLYYASYDDFHPDILTRMYT